MSCMTMAPYVSVNSSEFTLVILTQMFSPSRWLCDILVLDMALLGR
jgi:hypothetical protein